MPRESSHAPAESRERLSSLQELEPSPVDESPPEAEKGEYFTPSQPPPHPSHTLGLSAHSSTYWLTRIQKYSTYPLSAFLTAHITNTSIIPLVTQSVPASESYLLLTRPYYQSPLAEPLLIGIPLVAHLTSGLALRFIRRQHLLKRYGAETREERRRLAWPRLSGISALGLSLVPLIAGHVLVNRATPLEVEGGSSGVGLGYVSHGVAKYPLFANLAYAALIAVGCWHFVWGAAKWQGWLPENVSEESGYGHKRRRRRWWVLNAVAAAVTGLWMAGGMGVVLRGGPGAGWEAKGWDEILARVPVAGPWMV